jgi:hypothetical protein
VDEMSEELLKAISDDKADFLKNHVRFEEDITSAVNILERMLELK